MADQSNEMGMVAKVAAAIDAVQCFSRFNDWASDRVEGLPIEICRHGGDHEEEIVVVRRFPASADQDAALFSVVSEMRARAAIEAMRTPTEAMIEAIKTSTEVRRADGLVIAHGTTAVWAAAIDVALSHDEVKV